MNSLIELSKQNEPFCLHFYRSSILHKRYVGYLEFMFSKGCGAKNRTRGSHLTGSIPDFLETKTKTHKKNPQPIHFTDQC